MNKNQRRGKDLEREVVKFFIGSGLKAKRAYASNGESLGQDKEVDVVVYNWEQYRALLIQCKRKKKLPKYLGLTDNVDAVCFKEERGEIYIMLRLKEFILKFNDSNK